MSNVIEMKKGVKIPRSDLIVEQVTITPKNAAMWLQANQKNRPVRLSHVKFLAEQMLQDKFLINGESIKISIDENILDGQHRLLACIESGKSFKSIVVYGLDNDAFDTIDQGVIRTGADVLSLHYQEAPPSIVKATAMAAQHCYRVRNGWTTKNAHKRRSNYEILIYVNEHPELWPCAETISGYPRGQRLINLGLGTALYTLFNEKNNEMAREFMQKFFTGEDLIKTDVEYVLRSALIPKTLQRGQTLQLRTKGMMMVKAWNIKRKGKTKIGVTSIRLSQDESPPIIK